jgi:hypothetical protein
LLADSISTIAGSMELANPPFKCVAQTINAINNKNQHIGCPKWPDSIAECDKIADKWAK